MLPPPPVFLIGHYLVASSFLFFLSFFLSLILFLLHSYFHLTNLMGIYTPRQLLLIGLAAVRRGRPAYLFLTFGAIIAAYIVVNRSFVSQLFLAAAMMS